MTDRFTDELFCVGQHRGGRGARAVKRPLFSEEPVVVVLLFPEKDVQVMVAKHALSGTGIHETSDSPENRRTHSLLTTGVIPPPPTIEQIVQLMRDHFYNDCRFRDERIAVLEFRKRISWYAKNLHPCRQLRDDMRALRSPAEFEANLTRFLAWRNDRAAAYENYPPLRPLDDRYQQYPPTGIVLFQSAKSLA